MRRLAILIVAALVACMMLVSAVNAAQYTTKKHVTHQKMMKTHKTHKMAVHATTHKPRMVCHVVKHKRAMRVRRGAGPKPVCPAPIVNIPQQAAPVVNVPQQAAPVVNVAAPPPGVGITTDQCSIYIVKGDELIVLDKNTLNVTKKTNISE